MPAKKSKTKRYYHADGITYDEYSEGMAKLNFTDPSRKKFIYKTYEKGGVGPETDSMAYERYKQRSAYISKNRDARFTPSGDPANEAARKAFGVKMASPSSDNKSRGTDSSAKRVPLK